MLIETINSVQVENELDLVSPELLCTFNLTLRHRTLANHHACRAKSKCSNRRKRVNQPHHPSHLHPHSHLPHLPRRSSWQ